jgi:signal transduction histidine kinase/ActR/RegA family two-component response regulator
MIRPLPQIAAVLVTDAGGQPLLTAARQPVDPNLSVADLSVADLLGANLPVADLPVANLPVADLPVADLPAADRDAVQALRDGHQPALVGATAIGRTSNQATFPVVRRRGDDPQLFRGAILVFISPRELEAFDRVLLDANQDDTAGLYRDDGTLIAGYPSTRDPNLSGAHPNAGLMAAIAHDPTRGMARGAGSDGVDRLMAYRRLDSYPVYAVVARPWHSIVTEWRDATAAHLWFGIPATIALFAMSLLAARRARRETAARAQLEAEIDRRAQAEEALRQAQKMEAVGRLTGGIAHDFNNHLTVISSNVELLIRRLPDNAAGVVRLADAAMQGVRRAATLTQRLLAFSRQQTSDPEPLDASRLVAGMLDLLRRTLGESIMIETQSTRGLWLTRIDANQLESALLNLAVNARDAMPRGGRLTIETGNAALDEACVAGHAGLTPGQYVMLAVRDTGAGMPPEAQARAFEPFFTTKSLAQGTGLGLSMVHGFVAQSGGHVTIDSEAGRGTTVRLYLPRYTQPAAALAAAAGSPGRACGNQTVLVVEDDDTVRNAAVEVLREIGYQVLEAPDAMEAVRLLADRGGVDLLFTDVGLPGGVNGRALADAARNINPALKVVLTTGYTRESTISAGRMAEEEHFLAKPFTLQQLEEKIREVLDAPAAGLAVPLRTESA